MDSIPGFNPGILGLAFFNPEIPGLEKKSGIAISTGKYRFRPKCECVSAVIPVLT